MTTTDNEIPVRFMFAIQEEGRHIIDVESGVVLWTFGTDVLTRGEISLEKGVACAGWLNAVATKPEVARWIICEWDGDHELGYSAGGFFTKLLGTIAEADQTNMGRLEVGFPALVGAVRIWQNVSGSPQLLREFLREAWWVRKVPA